MPPRDLINIRRAGIDDFYSEGGPSWIRCAINNRISPQMAAHRAK
jgi:hypothetical protein